MLNEKEQTLDHKILLFIALLYLSTLAHQLLSKCIDPSFYRHQEGAALLVGIAGGLFSAFFSTERDIKDVLYTQAILFKLMLLPPMIYHQ
jgi:hypothetical protein